MTNIKSLFNHAQTPTVEVKQSDNIIRDNSVLIKLTIKGSSFERKVASADVIDDEVDSTMVTVTKSLIGKEYLKEITQLDGRIRSTVRAYGFRPEFIGDGFTLIPSTAVTQLEEKMSEFKDERRDAVERLIRKLPESKLEAQSRLGFLYREEEYPTAERLRKQFRIDYRYLSMNVPEALEEIDRDMFLEQQRKAAEMWQEAQQEIVQSLRISFADLVEAMSDKLTEKPGEKKVFKQGFINQTREFLELFDLKNISNDTELKALVDRARNVLAGETPESIRCRSDVRIRIQKTLGEIKQSLDTMIKDEGRAITL